MGRLIAVPGRVDHGTFGKSLGDYRPMDPAIGRPSRPMHGQSFPAAFQLAHGPRTTRSVIVPPRRWPLDPHRPVLPPKALVVAPMTALEAAPMTALEAAPMTAIVAAPKPFEAAAPTALVRRRPTNRS